MLIINDLHYVKDDTIIFNHTNLTIESGKGYLLEGVNGSGKTTLLNIISGMKKGEFKNNSQNIYSIDEESTINEISYIPDNPYLFDYLSGQDNLDYLEKLFNLSHEIMYKHLEKFHLEDKLTNLVKTYSLGMKVKLFLSAMLSKNNSLFLIDESITSLDRNSQEYVFKYLNANNTTYIVVAHTELFHAKFNKIVSIANHKLEVHNYD